MLNLYPFLTYMFVTTFTTGPNNVMSMSNAMRYGYKKTLGFLACIFIGFLVVMLLCGLLNFVLLSLLPQVKLWLNILGPAYIVYLANYIVLSKPVEESQSENGLNSIKAGCIMQFINLKVILYGITIFSIIIVQTYHTPLEVNLFVPLLATIAFIATSCWPSGEMYSAIYWTNTTAGSTWRWQRCWSIPPLPVWWKSFGLHREENS